jgi:hypothetical protein
MLGVRVTEAADAEIVAQPANGRPIVATNTERTKLALRSATRHTSQVTLDMRILSPSFW